MIFCYTSLSAQEFDGYALYNDRNNAFLIDKNGDIAHRWNCNVRSNYASFLKSNGNLVRGGVNPGNALNGPAVGGLVQEYAPDGSLVWEFRYSSSDFVAHHDICEMPNGGVLLTAWEVPQLSELQAMGLQENRVLYPTHFIEVQQDGTGGKIVWEWHMKDHFVQDVDSTLSNYGVIAENPQLMDINVEYGGGGGGPGGGNGDWFHVNGVHYNAEFDQIVFSSRFLSEIFIIDHSTTTAEAAGHTGGNSGMGGDILWRWGNPDNYDTPGERNVRAAVHDSRFIPDDGRIRAGYVQIFNNEGLDGSSRIDALELPRDGFLFSREPGQAYGPPTATWTHFCRDDADGQSASAALPNGNTYVNLSRNYMYEVDKDDNLVWQYSEGPSKGFRYTCDHPAIQSLISGGHIDATTCELSATQDISNNPVVVSPNPSTGMFHLTDLEEGLFISSVTVTEPNGRVYMVKKGDMNTVDLSYLSPAVYFMKIDFSNGRSVTKRVIIED